jgi:hypothetical protein
MPHAEALQVFYGSLPVALLLVAVYFRNETLLKNILERLTALETRVNGIYDWMVKVEHRLTVLETRAGVIYHE